MDSYAACQPLNFTNWTFAGCLFSLPNAFAFFLTFIRIKFSAFLSCARQAALERLALDFWRVARGAATAGRCGGRRATKIWRATNIWRRRQCAGRAPCETPRHHTSRRATVLGGHRAFCGAAPVVVVVVVDVVRSGLQRHGAVLAHVFCRHAHAAR